jgi:hypothetical protein
MGPFLASCWALFISTSDANSLSRGIAKVFTDEENHIVTPLTWIMLGMNVVFQQRL